MLDSIGQDVRFAVRALARSRGVTAAAVQPYVARGYTLIVAGVDTLYLANGAKALLAELRA